MRCGADYYYDPLDENLAKDTTSLPLQANFIVPFPLQIRVFDGIGN